MYAAPLVEPDVGAHGTLFVATETNDIYGFDAVTGQQLWTRNLGPAWNPADLDPNCVDITPSVGVTSTPAIDSATNTAYVVSKTYASGSAGPAAWYAHAIDLATGNERPNFPVLLQGSADNDPTAAFDATQHLQRPGLLLMNGVVYAAFGGHCDIPPYRGWVMGISTQGTARVGGPITARWTDEALVPPSPPEIGKPGGGIWQAGGRLVSDKPGEILLVGGNGVVPPAPASGSTPPTTLGESAIRLRVLATGSLQAVDFFSPCDAQRLSDGDLDIGSGAPLVLPDGFPGTAGTATPHPLVVVGKEGPIYVLNRDALGGFQQGSPNSCDGNPGQNGDNLASKAGKPPEENYGNWATPAMWPGDGGAIYVPYVPFGGAAAKFTAYRVINGFGQPALALAGQSQDRFGYGSSSAIITSDGTASGSGLVWIVWLPDSSGNNAELLAYDPNPTNGVLVLRGEWPIGQGNKFTTPTVNDSRIYIGARDGNVRAFAVLNQGATQTPPVPGSRTTTNQDQRPDREG